jgi:pimeloyl-ACP methyl ester carboxylesterase
MPALSSAAALTRYVVLPRGISLHVRLWGAPCAPLVVLLHGFPETGDCWWPLAQVLADEGWQVAAPDQRGYGGSDKPEGVGCYTVDALADDVLQLAKALGQPRFCVVGHDWGGIVAWHLAARDPQRLHAACILNAPHPASMAAFALTHPTQMLRSAYVGMFQMPLLPEWLLAMNDHSLLMRAMTSSSRPGSIDRTLLEKYRRSWRQLGSLRAMLNWYRALPRARLIRAPIEIPVRILWGRRDAALEPGLAAAARQYCRRAEVIEFPHATHWLHHEEPRAVAASVAGFLRDAVPARPSAASASKDTSSEEATACTSTT